jgi:hypothetical protein
VGAAKSGGVSAPTIRGVRTILPFDASTLVNYELGYRSDLAGGRVHFNATVFQATRPLAYAAPGISRA